ncbi:thiamine transport system ATP-binding protein [Nakamurella sp. UYEF19]|uniref:ABC transporter ATP-binding protein n=1 Tax=Nakamurella sp. UYEF19 TaxID=1756392 RepID=UPI003391CDD8
MPGGSSMLSLDGVSVSYGKTTAVDRVSLEVPDGAVMCLLGPSGCGKSTLLRAVAGLEPIGSGAIGWDGTDLAGVPVHRRGFGLMFQSGVLFPHLDVGENIAYGLRRDPRRWGRDQRRQRVEDLLELVGLAGYGSRGITTLSGGQAQRVALARALAPEPRLLLLDEPLAALDAELRERLVQTLRDALTRTGTTAVYVTHDQREAFAVADTVGLMQDGSIRQTGSPVDVWAQPQSEWAAGFVGFSSIVDRAALAVLVSDAGPCGLPDRQRIALRPAAFVFDERGGLEGVVEGILASPESLRLRLEVEGLGAVDAVAPPTTAVMAGQSVRVRFDPTACAGLGA